jgi:hypothetical protein
MATQLQLRKGNTAQTAVFTGAVAEVTVDTEQKTIVVHDGVTTGGKYIATESRLQGAWTTANGANGLASGAYAAANATNGYAVSAYATANGANGLAAGAFNTANGANGLAAGAYNTANAVNGYATSAYAAANGANGMAVGAYGKANTANVLAQSAFDSSNNVNGYATSAYARANSAYSYTTQVEALAYGAYNTANTASNNITIIQGVDLTQNAAISVIQGVDLAQNTRMSIIEGVNAGQNTTITAVNNFAASAYNTANGANGLAQGAYDNANTKFSSSGGTISGSVTVAGPVTISGNNNLVVTGNLSVLGTTTSINTTTYEVVDPMIVLGIGNYTTDLVDIGFAGHYNNGSNAHTGLIRDSGTKDWYLFQGYTPELSGNNNIDINNASFSTANLIAKQVTANLVATTITIGGRDQASVDASQNTNITSVNQYAASGYALANTNAGLISIIQGVDLGQNTTITAVNNYAASGYAQANTANTRAYASVAKAGDTMSGALTGITNLGTSSVTFDNAYRTSNTFTTASTSQVAVDSFSATTYRSAKYQVQVTSGTDYHVIELLVVHNGTTTFLAQYGEIFTTSSLGTFDTDISGGNVRLLFTGVNSVSVIKVIRDAINS